MSVKRRIGDVNMTVKVKNAIQDEYADAFSWCFGCGRLNTDGNHLRTGWHDETTVSYYNPKKNEIGIPGFLYGGLLASLIDCHGTGSSALALHRKNGYEPGDGEEPPRFVTASLNVAFLKPTPHGIELKLVGKVTEVHPKRFEVAVEVFAGDEVCATGDVVSVVMPASFMQQKNS